MQKSMSAKQPPRATLPHGRLIQYYSRSKHVVDHLKTQPECWGKRGGSEWDYPGTLTRGRTSINSAVRMIRTTNRGTNTCETAADDTKEKSVLRYVGRGGKGLKHSPKVCGGQSEKGLEQAQEAGYKDGERPPWRGGLSTQRSRLLRGPDE